MYINPGVLSIAFFTITAEIHACSLANFYCQYADRHMNLKIHAMHQRARGGNSAICYRKKQIDVSFNASVLLLIIIFIITLSK